MNLLEVKTTELATIKTELEAKIKKAPAFFENAPLVLGFEMLSDELHEQFDLAGLIALCKNLQLYPAASRGGNSSLQQKSIKLQLATLAKGREKHIGATTEKPNIKQEPSSEPARISSATDNTVIPSTTKIITTPIRSGQQIYAPGGDLIVMSSVSAGAEVLADGNIHIYGALRGRALAGVKGNEKTRIFCSSQEAELVSIAGHFLVDDQLKSTHWKTSVQILTVDDNIVIRPLL